MQVHTLQLQRLAIKQEATVGIKHDFADARSGFIDIHNPAVHLHHGLHLIQIGVGSAPQMRIRELHDMLRHTRLLGFQRVLVSIGTGHLLPLGIYEPLLHLILLCLQTAVRHLGLDTQHHHVVRFLQFCIDKRPEGSHAHLGRLLQPHIAVDAGTFVEPALLQRGIGTYADQVILPVFHIRSDVVHLSGIATGFRAHVEPVEPHLRRTEDAVETQHQSLPQVVPVYLDHLAIPPHASFGIFVAHRLVAMRVTGFTGIGQRRHPIVGHGDGLPGGIIEFLCIRALVVDGVCLRQVVEVLRATAKVLRWIGSMAESEFPTFIEQNFLSYVLGVHTKGDHHPTPNNHHPTPHFLHIVIVLIQFRPQRYLFFRT